MGGKSGRPVLVLSPAKLAQVDATIKADFDKKVTDPIINTALKNNLGLAQKTLSRACKMMDFHAYKIVTSPARGGRVLTLRVCFYRAWQALLEAEKDNMAYSDDMMFTLHGSTNRLVEPGADI